MYKPFITTDLLDWQQHTPAYTPWGKICVPAVRKRDFGKMSSPTRKKRKKKE
jgi:hypothetical protein